MLGNLVKSLRCSLLLVDPGKFAGMESALAQLTIVHFTNSIILLIIIVIIVIIIVNITISLRRASSIRGLAIRGRLVASLCDVTQDIVMCDVFVTQDIVIVKEQ